MGAGQEGAEGGPEGGAEGGPVGSVFDYRAVGVCQFMFLWRNLQIGGGMWGCG